MIGDRSRPLAAVLVPLLLLLAGLRSPAMPADAPQTAYQDEAFLPDAPLPFDPKASTGQLSNGLRFYLRHNEEPRDRAELRLVVNAGSILEDDDQQGLAHLLEHMAFNGTEHYAANDLVDYLESIGMDFGPEINAYTGFDQTVYLLKIPTDESEIVDKAVEILAEWARRMSLDPVELEKEKGVVIEEWRLGRGAEQRMRDIQLPVLYHGSRYAERLPIGRREIIEGADREQIMRFYHDWYRPDLMAVIAVGDFDLDLMRERIDREFGDFVGPEHERERLEYDVPDHENTLVSIATDPEATTSRIRLVVKQPRQHYHRVSEYRQAMIESLYDGMFNQRLYERVQEENPPFISAYSGSGSLGRARDSITLSAIVENGGIVRGLEAALTEAVRVQRYGFTQTELDREKKDILRSLRKRFQEREKTRSASYAGAYIGHFLTDDPVPGIEYRYGLYQRLLPAITLEEINALERDWMSRADRVLLANGPRAADVSMPTEGELRPIFERVSSAAVEPYVDDVGNQPLVAHLPIPGSIVLEKHVDEIGLTEWKLSNGVRVLVKPTNFKEDQLLMSARSPGGRSLGNPVDDLSLDFASLLVRAGGVGDYDAIQLQKLLAGKRVSVSPVIRDLEEGFQGGGSPEDLETLLQLVYLYFTEPRRDEKAFASRKSRYMALLANRENDPASAFRDSLNVILSSHHPSARPLTSERIEALDLDRAMDFYRERFADASDFTFYFVGTVDLENLKPLVATWLGGLPELDRKESWRDIGVRYPHGIIERSIHEGVDDKSRTAIVFTGPFEWTRIDRFAIGALGSALQIRLREVIREDLSGTYGVSVGASPSRDPVTDYRLSISFGADPERLDGLVVEVFKVLREVRENGLGAEYVQKVQESRRREIEEGMRQNGFWLSSLAFRDRYDLDQREVLDSEKIIEQLDPAMIRDAARQYLDLDNYVRVDLVPEDAGGELPAKTTEEAGVDGGSRR